MSAVNVRTAGGDELARTVELPAEVFDVELSVPLVHQVVVGQMAGARQGTAKVKTRGETRGGGRKPYRQKGTGRARQGSIRAPQFTGGGTVHGPVPRDHSHRTPKKMIAAALRQSLSDRARGGRVHVVDSLVAGDGPSTKAAQSALSAVSGARRVLVVAERTDVTTWKSVRNLVGVHVLDPGQLNAYDVLVADDVVFTESALQAFLSRPGPRSRRGAGAAPDLAPHHVPGGTPSVAAATAPDATATLGGGTSEGDGAAAPVDDAEAVAAPGTDEVATPDATTDDAASTAGPTTDVEDDVSEEPATQVGTTTAAGEGVDDAEMAREVEEQTAPDREAEPVFAAQAEGADTDTEIAKASDAELAQEVDPRDR